MSQINSINFSENVSNYIKTNNIESIVSLLEVNIGLETQSLAESAIKDELGKLSIGSIKSIQSTVLVDVESSKAAMITNGILDQLLDDYEIEVKEKIESALSGSGEWDLESINNIFKEYQDEGFILSILKEVCDEKEIDIDDIHEESFEAKLNDLFSAIDDSLFFEMRDDAMHFVESGKFKELDKLLDKNELVFIQDFVLSLDSETREKIVTGAKENGLDSLADFFKNYEIGDLGSFSDNESEASDVSEELLFETKGKSLEYLSDSALEESCPSSPTNCSFIQNEQILGETSFTSSIEISC